MDAASCSGVFWTELIEMPLTRSRIRNWEKVNLRWTGITMGRKEQPGARGREVPRYPRFEGAWCMLDASSRP